MLTHHAAVKWIGAIALCAGMQPVHAVDWLPIDPADLSMTEEPKAPKAPAIYLYRQVDRDDQAGAEDVYIRIKILTDEGRKYGDVAIPYVKNSGWVRNVEARTISPDGSVIEFNGETYDNLIVQNRNTKMLARTFALPDVQVGSILEYQYRTRGFTSSSGWILNANLFTKHARFSFKPSRFFTVRYSWPQGLPPGTNPPAVEKGVVRLEAQDVAAFVSEDFMPPENQVKQRVDFVYQLDNIDEKNPDEYWDRYAKLRYRSIEKYLDKPRQMRNALTQIVSADDSDEVKLRKIYEKVQSLRNVSFERSKSEDEIEREKLKDQINVAQVWDRGYGDRVDLNWLFLGLVRTAGLQADPIFVSMRDRIFFDHRVMNPWQLNAAIVRVKLNDQELFLDPGTPFTPFGVLPWELTGVKALVLAKTGATWVVTPISEPGASRISRKAHFKLTTNGALEGTVTVAYTGLEALWRRLSKRDDDEVERKKFLERELEYDIPRGIEANLSNSPEWNGSVAPLIAEYTVRIPGWASVAGSRSLVTVGIFGNDERNALKHAARTHPLYFHFPYSVEDDVTIDMPDGWEIGAMPPPRTDDRKVVSYNLVAEKQNESVRIRRDLSFNIVLLDAKYYPQLRDFYQTVRTNDEQQIVAAPAAGKRNR